MSPESDYMYSDSEDLLIIANMYNMKVIIVTDGEKPRIDEIMSEIWE